jgi:adenosine kinase
MGNPLLDISANVGQDLLDKYELKLDTAILAEDRHQPLYKELIENYDVQYIAGGATQNSCRVAQWMLKAAGKSDHQVAFFGCVGNDEYGKTLAACAASDGVLTHYMKDNTTPTGTCAALIHNRERALVANLAAANNFRPSHLQDPISQEIIQAAQFFYCAGFFLTVSVESLVQVAEHAVQANKIFCLNLSAPFIVEFFKEQLATALPYADFVFGNESEAETYGKVNGIPTDDDLKAVALAIAEYPKKNPSRPRTVVITKGSQSTLVVQNGVVAEYPVEPLPLEKIVDTNGAGDAFVGGFLSQLVQGQNDLAKAVHAGHFAARYIIQVSGTTLSTPCEYV